MNTNNYHIQNSKDYTLTTKKSKSFKKNLMGMGESFTIFVYLYMISLSGLYKNSKESLRLGVP